MARTSPAESARALFPRREPFRVDVRDAGDEYVVTADLPGLRTRDIDVNAKKNRIQIVADFGEAADGRYHRRERESGTRMRTVRLPRRIDTRRVRASYDDGVLRIHARKRRPPRELDLA